MTPSTMAPGQIDSTTHAARTSATSASKYSARPAQTPPNFPSAGRRTRRRFGRFPSNSLISISTHSCIRAETTKGFSASRCCDGLVRLRRHVTAQDALEPALNFIAQAAAFRCTRIDGDVRGAERYTDDRRKHYAIAFARESREVGARLR